MRKTIPMIMAAATASTIALTSCGGSSHDVAIAQAESSEIQNLSLEDEILVHINRYRATKGRAPLKAHEGLRKLAAQHSEYMRKNSGDFGLINGHKTITHFGFDARATIALRKYQIESLGENVLSGKGSAASMVKGWISSPNHEHNISASWVVTGISATEGPDGRVWVTQLFGSKPQSNMVNGMRIGGPMSW